MCGIVGYVGFHAIENVITALDKLDYRGYDSSGIAYYNNGFQVLKKQGRLSNLKEIIKKCDSNLAIGHTRWATHGISNDINAHPHYSYDKRFIIVHNGIVENYLELKQTYLGNINHVSSTDTEVLVNLIAKFYDGDSFKAIRKALNLVKGSYAIIVIDTKDKTLYIAKRNSPLLIGVKDSIMITSDLITLNDYSFAFIMKDNSIGIINDDISFYDENGIKMECEKISINNEMIDISLNNYKHYMYKEIYEFKDVIKRIKEKYIIDKQIDKRIFELLKKDIYIIGSGSSYHSGLMAKVFFNKHVYVYRASEFIYDINKIDKDACFILMSQSGETADLINVIPYLGDNTILITNSVNSTLSRKTKYVLNMYANKEIAVASTKAYMAQVLILYILANKLNCNDEIEELLNGIDDIYEYDPKIKEFAKKLNDKVVYIGSGIDYYLCMEASLKLKEVSYINCYSYPCGELKHGPLAIVDDKTNVILISSTNNINKTNLLEATSRGAIGSIIGLNEDFSIPFIKLNFILIIIVFDLISYYKAIELGLDVDKPKNLAKSVTVI